MGKAWFYYFKSRNLNEVQIIFQLSTVGSTSVHEKNFTKSNNNFVWYINIF